MTTDTHDTAAALKAVLAAIDSDTHDGHAVSLSDHAALHRAITAHVEAEVARRLAAAPGLDEAISEYARRYAADGLGSTGERSARLDVGAALRRNLLQEREAAIGEALQAAPDVEAAIGDLLGQIGCAAHHRDSLADALRAAIAADKARAVAEVRAAVVGEGADRIVDAIAEAAARSLVAPVVAMAARPTPDEARRLVDALETAAFEWGMRRNDYERDATATARTALLRALGVEA